jgi:tRNA 2-thiouridine synthesizing protein A
MKFMTECKADATADLVYRACPMHLLEPMKLIKDLGPGQVLEILTDYDGALEDIPA